MNTSYYVRGQYTLIDTMPLARRRAVLWPPETPETASSASEWPSNSTSAQVPPLPQGSILSPTTTTSPENVDHFASDSPATNGKEPQVFMIPGQTFSFSLKIPAHHYRDEDFELPPSCQVFQVGLQAGVEYVLRVKLSRKGWRLNET